MIEKNVTAATADEKIKQLYETAFPEDEQIPWKDLMRLVEEMPFNFPAYYDDEDFIGFTIVYPRKSINWFWYFAVCEELRGKGYGQKILTQMIERYKGRSCVLDLSTLRCNQGRFRSRRRINILKINKWPTKSLVGHLLILSIFAIHKKRKQYNDGHPIHQRRRADQLYFSCWRDIVGSHCGYLFFGIRLSARKLVDAMGRMAVYVQYAGLVSEVSHEPNYEEALKP